MTKHAAVTKNCLAPWQTFIVWPSGKVDPCCGVPLPAGDFGNVNEIDLGVAMTSGPDSPFSNEAYRKLRAGLLSGDLPTACAQCRVVGTRDMIPTERLGAKVRAYLSYARRDGSSRTDLTRAFAFRECLVNITDKCNLACIYCFAHSNDARGDGIRKYAELDRRTFLALIDSMVLGGLERLVFCGVGELTIYKDWQGLCLELMRRHPELQLCLVTNFTVPLSAQDVRVLARFDEISVSCDTLDRQKFAWLRSRDRLPVLLSRRPTATADLGRAMFANSLD